MASISNIHHKIDDANLLDTPNDDFIWSVNRFYLKLILGKISIFSGSVLLYLNGVKINFRELGLEIGREKGRATEVGNSSLGIYFL